MGVDLFNSRDEWLTKLDESIDDFKKEGLKTAQYNRDYRRVKARKILEYRSMGYQVSIINDLTNGDETVSEIRFKADCAEVLYSAAKESIQAAKRHLDVIREDIEREYRG